MCLLVLLVDCRIGSLEMSLRTLVSRLSVDCRIGSLETMLPEQAVRHKVDCRIGSLEIEDYFGLPTGVS